MIEGLFMLSLLLTLCIPKGFGFVNDSFALQFLGNPLLVLCVLLILAAIAVLYHRVRK